MKPCPFQTLHSGPYILCILRICNVFCAYQHCQYGSLYVCICMSEQPVSPYPIGLYLIIFFLFALIPISVHVSAPTKSYSCQPTFASKPLMLGLARIISMGCDINLLRWMVNLQILDPKTLNSPIYFHYGIKTLTMLSFCYDGHLTCWSWIPKHSVSRCIFSTGLEP